MLIVFTITSIETVGDVAATEEASFISTEGPSHDKRIRGALLNDGIGGIFSALVGGGSPSVGAACLDASIVVVRFPCGCRMAGPITLPLNLLCLPAPHLPTLPYRRPPPCR